MTISLTRLRAFGRANGGATAVEFALVAPILFLLLFAIIEFGRAWWTKSSLQFAADQAARYGVVCATGACPADGAIMTYAANKVYEQSVGANTFSVTHPAGVLCVNYSFNYAPWFVDGFAAVEGTLTFTGASCRAHT